MPSIAEKLRETKTGREHVGSGSATGPENDSYSLALIHKGNGTVDWQRSYGYANDSNRLESTAVGQTTVNYAYNVNGSMTTMPHLQAMDWDFAERLSLVARGTTEAYYTYDGSGQRVRKVVVKGNIVETLTAENGSAVATPAPVLRYQPDDHLDFASLELDGNANVISYEEYYPYGDTSYQAGRSTSEVSRKRYRYTGKEKDEESGLYYHGARYYACWLGRWTASDPAGMVDGVNLYMYVRGNPVRLSDPSGNAGEFSKFSATDTLNDLAKSSGYEGWENALSNANFFDPKGRQVSNEEIRNRFDESGKWKRGASSLTGYLMEKHRGGLNVTSKSGESLFVLESANSQSRTITVQDLYKEKVQWFEPEADNYHKLLSTSDTFTKSSSAKHFTWNDIASFAEKDRWMVSYRSGGSGDWKASPEGGDKYLLVDVGGTPYWGDAIGQIPFAVDLFTDELEAGKNAKDAIMTTMDEGRKHGAGQVFGGEPDKSATYDNLMVLRATLYASKRFSVSTDGKLTKNQIPASTLASPVSPADAKKYRVKQ